VPFIYPSQKIFFVHRSANQSEAFSSSDYKKYFMNTILEGFNTSRNHGEGQRVTKRIFVHMDNFQIHHAQESSIKIRSMKMTRLPHPSYSPDLSPCDFWSFGRTKNSLRNGQFDDADALLERLISLFDGIIF
jgi:transposase